MNKITCQLCGEATHVIQAHLKKSHEGVSVEDYQKQFPMAPMLSAEAERALREKLQKEAVTAAPQQQSDVAPTSSKAKLADVFGFGDAKAAKNARGDAIMINVYNIPELAHLVPERDPGYVFDIPLTKTCLMALEMNIPGNFWGHAGVGKSTLIEQVCAHTGRPMLRLQHTANTEESDVEGKYVVRNGEMIWEDGPLPFAMQKGMVYLADEYDFASPMVLSLYQAVLEGKPLYIKACNKTVKPAPGFRFIATGNTNGAGDDTGLYAGTQLQNAANYERFGIVERVEYMPEAQEIAILVAKSGVDRPVAEKLAQYARMTRTAFDNKDVSIPMSPRAVFRAAQLGLARHDWKFGIERAYINRLPPASAEFAKQTMQRVFG